MKQNVFEVVDISGTSKVCFDANSIENVAALNQGQLMFITTDGLVEYTGNLPTLKNVQENSRFVIAKTKEERDLLLQVKPFKCFLRNHDMSSKTISVNPYQSVRWLRNLVEKQKGMPVTLIVKEQVLLQDGDSLLQHMDDSAIVHVLEDKHPEHKLSVLYTKEPGNQSPIYRLQQVKTKHTIDWLTKHIATETKLPYENIVLVYGGRILSKDKTIAQSRIHSNGIVYAVDSTKYMKKVSKEEYQNRVQQIRKAKQSYKQLLKKMKTQENDTSTNKSKISVMSQKREQNKKLQQQQQKKRSAAKGQYQKSATEIEKKQDDTKYFKDKVMKIESKEYDEFSNLPEQLRDKVQSQPPIQPQTTNLAASYDLNSPIMIFNRLNSLNRADSIGQQQASELKQGRVVTKQIDTYQDSNGYTHQHSKQKTLYKDGTTKIVDVDVAEDEQGNIVKVQRDIVNIRRDIDTGNTFKTQTDIIQDGNQNKTIVKKQQVRDQVGNIIKQETQVIKNQSGHKQIKKHQMGVHKQGDKIVTVNNQILEDSKGQPYKIQTDITERKQNAEGTTTQYSKDIKQQNGVTSVIQRNVTRDKEGNVIELKTDIIKITEDQLGNIYKHERNQTDTENKKVIIERDIVTDSKGDVISKQTNMKVIHQDENNNIVKHETDVIQQKDGRAFVIEKSTVEDADGKVIKSESQMFQLNKQGTKQPKQVQIMHENPQVVQIEGQREPMINGGKQVKIDQLGNIHIHEKQLIQKQGKTTFVDRDTIQDPRGKVIRVQTDIVKIEGDSEGNMHKHKSQIIEQQGKVTMIQTDEIMNPDGQMIRKQKDTIEIQGGQDGSIFKHEKDVIEQQGITKIIQRDIIEDADGNVIKSQTKVTEVQQGEEAIEVRQKEEIIEAVDENQIQGEPQQMQKQIEVVEDAQGNVIRRQQEVTQNQDGDRVFVDRCTVQNSSGEVVRQQTEVINVVQGENAPQIQRHIIDYSESDNKVLIQESISRENVDGSVVRAQTETLEIQQLEDGTVKKREMDVVEQDGRKVVHVRNTVEDQSGRLLSKTSNTVELEAIDTDNMPLPIQQQQNYGEVDTVEKMNVDRTYNYDSQGNLHLYETEVRNSEGRETQIERQFVSNPQGEVIKTETGIINVVQQSDGSTKLTAIDIVQHGNITTIIENDSIKDAEGNQIRNESGTMRIKELQLGIKKKTKENIIQEGGIKLRVEKETYEDAEGHIIQQKIKTTQLVERIDEDQNRIMVSEEFKRKQQSTNLDEDGNTRFFQREIIDNQQGKTTVIETEVIRNEQNQLVQATTDVVEVTQLEDGNVHRHEVNIVEKQGKITMAQSNAVQNQEGDKLQGQVESVIVTKGQNGEIIKKETGIIMEDEQKTIVETTIVEDAEGNVIKTSTIKKRIYVDENGVQRGRDLEVYQADDIEIKGDPSTIQKLVNVDVQGNVQTQQRLTVIKQQGGKEVVQATTVTVTEANDGTIVDQSMNVTTVIQNENGQIEVIEKNIPIQSRGQAELQPIEPFSPCSQVIEDQKGNLHTFQKQVRRTGQNKYTVIKSQTIEDPQGKVIQINTNVVDSEQLGDGKVLKHKTEMVTDEKITSTETYTIQNPDGTVISERTQRVQISEDDGLIKTNKTNIKKEAGNVKIDNVQVLQDEDGNIIDQNSNKLEIQDTQQAVRTQARKVAKAEISGQITGVVKQVRQDAHGNIHLIETQTIEDHGNKIIVDSQTVQNSRGEIIQVQTDILQQKQLQNGKVEKHKTVITERGGELKVVQYSEIKQGEGNLKGLSNQSKSRVKFASEKKSEDLLGLAEQQKVPLHESAQFAPHQIDPKNEKQVGQLLGSNKQISNKQIGELPLESRKVLAENKDKVPSQKQVKQQQKTQQKQEKVQQFEVVLIDKQRNRRQTKVISNQTIGEVVSKLSSEIGANKQDVKFYKDGEELPESATIAALNMENGSQIYYSDEKQK